MYNSFLWVLLLVTLVGSHVYEQYPGTIEQAEELLIDGIIDSVQYDVFVSLLMNPIDLVHDDPTPLYELFDSSDIVALKEAVTTGTGTTSLEDIRVYMEPYLIIRSVELGEEEKRIGGTVRSFVRCDSSGARSVLYLQGGSKKILGSSALRFNEQALAVEKRSVKVSIAKTISTAGSFSLPLPIGVIRPVLKDSIADSLTLLYGDGRLFNGLLSKVSGTRFSFESSMSYLPSEQHVSGTVMRRVPFGSISFWGLGRSGNSSLCGGAVEFSTVSFQSLFAPESGAALTALKLRMGSSTKSKSFRALFFNHTKGLESLSLVHAVDNSRGVKMDLNIKESWKRIRLTAALSTLVQDYSSKVFLQGVVNGGDVVGWSYSAYYIQQGKKSFESVARWIQKAALISPVAQWGIHGEGTIGLYHIKQGIEKVTIRAGMFWQWGNSPSLSCIYKSSFNHLYDELHLGVEARESLKNRFGFSAVLKPQDMKKTKLYSAIRFTF